MTAKQQKFDLLISEKYTAEERRAIAAEIISRITERTQEENRDKNGRPFPGYSKAYKESLEYKIAGKTGDVNLTLSGEMMDMLQLLRTSKGKIEIGYKAGDKVNGKVEGNRLGTYGQSKQVAPKRDFLGITQKELKDILRNYPLRNEEKRRESVEEVKLSGEIAEDVLRRVGLTDDEDE
jgi:hypothetical protein